MQIFTVGDYQARLRNEAPIQKLAKKSRKVKHGQNPNIWWNMAYKGSVEGIDPDAIKLRDLLLSFGGVEARIDDSDPDMKRILNCGTVMQCPKMRIKRKRSHGKTDHESVAQDWLNRKDMKTFAIVTGYAMGKDGIWRRHTWELYFGNGAIGDHNWIVDYKDKYLLYFGWTIYVEEGDGWAKRILKQES